MVPLYLDYNASTPLDPRVQVKMAPYLGHEYGNPNSNHVMGWTAKKAIDHARSQVAKLIGCQNQDVIFTSGATEATSLALLGVFYDQILNQKKVNPHFITTDVEHACVLETFKFMQKLGAEISVLPTKPYGQLSSQQLKSALRPSTVLVSVIWVNNEIGTINHINELSEVTRNAEVLFHTDATQGAGKIPFQFSASNVDLLSLSGHKLYGPKGVGALIRRYSQPGVKLVSMISGGGQEQGLRSGTQNVAGIVGLGEACEICKSSMDQDLKNVEMLGQILLDGLKNIFPDLILNGHPQDRSAYNFNLTLPSLNLDLVANSLLKICYSRGSACHSNDPARRDVLTNLGVSENLASRSLRLSIGRMSTQDEIRQVIEIFKKLAIDKNSSESLKLFSPGAGSSSHS
ncbi:MAG: cysteine desulfurase family protein [Pseudobdellovibrionaceae bacterium]